MITHFILRFSFAFAILLGVSNENNTAKKAMLFNNVPVSQPENTVSKQHEVNSIWLLLSYLADSADTGHHDDHDENKSHCLSFDRIRRREYGFSCRCAVVKLLLIVLHIAILLSIQRQFSYSLKVEHQEPQATYAGL